jgi:hypothetical protein
MKNLSSRYNVLYMFLLFVCLSCVNLSFAEESEGSQPNELLLRVINSEAIPLSGSIYSENTSLNQALDSFNVTIYSQVFYNTDIDPFQDLYYMVCECEIDDLIEHLDINFVPTLFLDVFKGTHDIEPIQNSYDPENWMWQEKDGQAEGWLWFLEKIQADEAWAITTGDPNVKIAVLGEFNYDVNHPDLVTEFLYDHDPSVMSIV